MSHLEVTKRMMIERRKVKKKVLMMMRMRIMKMIMKLEKTHCQPYQLAQLFICQHPRLRQQKI